MPILALDEMNGGEPKVITMGNGKKQTDQEKFVFLYHNILQVKRKTGRKEAQMTVVIPDTLAQSLIKQTVGGIFAPIEIRGMHLKYTRTTEEA